MSHRIRNLAAVSWLGGAASLLPFAEEWFGLSRRASNLALLGAVASAFALGVAVRASAGSQRLLSRLAGPPERPVRALVLVAVFAAAGALAMLAATALLGTT